MAVRSTAGGGGTAEESHNGNPYFLFPTEATVIAEARLHRKSILKWSETEKKRSLRSLFCLSLPRSVPPLATSSLFVSVLPSLTQIHTISISLSVFPSSPSLLFLSQPSRLAFIKVLSPRDRPDGVFLPIKGPANNKQV